MQSENRRILSYSGAAVFITIGIACVVKILATLPLWEEKTPEWIGALGTIAAFVGTIWIANTEGRRRRRAEADLATMAAADLFDRVVAYRGKIEGVREGFGREGELERDALEAYREWLETTELWTREEIMPLTVLPEQVGPRLQRVASRHLRLVRGISELKHATRQNFLNHRYETVRGDLLKSAEDLKQTEDVFRQLLRHLYGPDDYMS